MPPTKPPTAKKVPWFARNRLRLKHVDASQDRALEMNSVQLYFNTKRANSVLEENFLHPIIVPSPDEILIVPETQTKPRRKSLFGTSLKKKIGPMEVKTKETKVLSRNSIDGKILSTDQIQTLRKMVECSSKKNSLTGPSAEEIEIEEQGDFVMSPTKTDDLTEVSPVECEARQILEKLGITSETLCQAIESGPRSDIIGCYRIIVHRLQKQKMLAKTTELNAAAAAAAADIEPMGKPKNNTRTCAIL